MLLPGKCSHWFSGSMQKHNLALVANHVHSTATSRQSEKADMSQPKTVSLLSDLAGLNASKTLPAGSASVRLSSIPAHQSRFTGRCHNCLKAYGLKKFEARRHAYL